MPKPRTWLFIALGVVALLIGGALLVVGAGAWFFTRHVQVEATTPDTAAKAFEDVRRRFEGEAPLISLDEKGGVSTVELDRRRGTYAGPLPEMLRLMAWEEGEEQLVRLSFPFWLLRFQKDSSMKIDLDGFRMDSLGVTHEDIRLAGPALVLDLRQGKSHVLLWTE